MKQQASDFDRGFGIGGLGRYEESPPSLTIEQLEQLDEMKNRATYCRICGASDIFDGAMFTNGGGDVCDDCF